ncbi:family 16 glycoside hydrolase, partial [Bacteroidota bacterium]
VEDGILVGRYDQWDSMNGEYGHIFYKEPFSYYRLRIEYRIVGEEIAGAPWWGFKNSGIMIHSQSPSSMLIDQDFPVCIECQLLGGYEEGDRRTLGVCTPGTHIVLDGELYTEHCKESTAKTFRGEEWVSIELVVLGNELIHHIVEGDTVLTYSKSQISDGTPVGFPLPEGTMLESGYIALQVEGHSFEFRKVELLDLSEKYENELSVLVVTGGHRYDTTEFNQMFESMDNISCDFVFSAGMQEISPEKLHEKYDALVFLDMNQEVSDEYKKQYAELTELGTGLVFLHFTLASCQSWDEYHEMVGGKFYLQSEPDSSLRSGYKTELEMEVKVLDPDHPVTAGITDFTILDAGYNNLYISSSIHPLLGVENPYSAEYVGWTHKYNNSPVVYIMPGYSKIAFSDESYKQLVENSIKFVSR